jgi:hypothetical protein
MGNQTFRRLAPAMSAIATIILSGCAVSNEGAASGPGAGQPAILAGLGPSAATPANPAIAGPQDASAATALAATPPAPMDARAALDAQPQAAGLPSDPAAAGPSIRFAPVIGAPIEAVAPLSRRLGQKARGAGIAIRSFEDPASDHVLKGYLAAETTEDGTIVIFVWDVLDGAGNRLHRISGSEQLTVADAAAGWAGITDDVMEQVAARTIAGYLAWRAPRETPAEGEPAA